MKTIYKTLLFSLLALISLHTNAQSFYRPGYVVTSQGDTLTGLVGFRENKKSFQECLFKASQEDPTKTFIPTDILSYGYVNDKILESRFVTEHSGDSTKVFLQVLARGEINLYLYNNIFYVEKGNKKLLPLSIFTEDGSIARSNYHLSIMQDITLECPELGTNLEKLVLARRSLTEVVEKYNRCVAPSTVSSIKIIKPWVSFSKGLLIGASSSTLSFKDAHVRKEYLTKANFTHSPSLNVGAFFLLSSPRTSERFSLQVEATYNQDKFEGFAEVPGPYTATSRNYITTDLSIVKAATLLRYAYPNASNYLPYLSGGLSNNFVLNATTTRKLEIDHGSGVIRESNEEAFTPPNHFFGITAALGTTYAHKGKEMFTVEVKYDRGYKIHNNDRDLLRYSDASSASHTISFLIGYFL